MPHPLIGTNAPTLTLPGADGETYTLAPGTKGVPVALFFYPKSGMHIPFHGIRTARTVTQASLLRLCNATGSYGCTKEACQFRDALAGMQLAPFSTCDMYTPTPIFCQTRTSSNGPRLKLSACLQTRSTSRRRLSISRS